MSAVSQDLGAAIILIISPQGIPFVRNLKRGRTLWRLPGGHIEKIQRIVRGVSLVEPETPEQAASRELRQETGFIVHPRYITVESSEPRRDHKRYLCLSRVDRLVGTQLRIGDGGEETRLFTAHEALYGKNFLPDHRRLIRPYLTNEISKFIAGLKSAN